MATIIKTPKEAKDILQKILDDRKLIEIKTDLQLGALDWGAAALERACRNGACFHREWAIIRYHANNMRANLLHDEITRGALKAAVFALYSWERQEAGEEDEGTTEEGAANE